MPEQSNIVDLPSKLHAVQSVSTIACICNTNGQLQHVSGSAATKLHAQPHTLIGRYWFDLVVLEDRILALQYQQQFKTNIGAFSGALRFQLNMEHHLWFKVCFEPIGTEAAQWLIIIELNSPMNFSHAFNNLLEHLEQAPFATFLLNQALEICYCSENSAYLLESNVRQLHQCNFITAIQHLLSKKDNAQLEYALSQVVKGVRVGYLGTYKLSYSECSRCYKCLASMQNTLMDKPTLMLFLQDVSEQEQIRHSLKTANEYLNFHINNMPLAVIEWNQQQQIIRWSSVAEQLFGWQANEILGKKIESWLFTDTMNMAEITNIFKFEHKTAKKEIYHNVTKTGDTLTCEWHFSCQYDEQGQLISALAFIQKITTREYNYQALENTHENLVFHIDNVPSACLEWDTKLHLVRWSHYAESLFGWKAKDVLGLHYLDCPFFLPKELNTLTALLDELISGKSTYFFNHSTHQNKEGNIILCDWYSSALIINNELVSILSFGYDVTANEKLRRTLLESESRFRQLTENIRDIFFIRDFNDYRHNYISPAYERIFHHPCSVYLADPYKWLDYVHPDDKEIITKSLAQQRLGLNTDIQYRIKHSDNELIWLHEKAFPITNQEGQVFRVVGVCEEITNYKNLEFKQTFANQQLYAANRELARASRLKDEFIANVSHELKTPLNVIMNNTELLLEHVYGPLNEMQNTHLNLIYYQGDKLLGIINSIIHLSQAEAGKLELNFKPVSCQKICRDSFNFIDNSILKKKQYYNLTLDSRVKDIIVDEYFFKQILIILLDNACKFTPQLKPIGLEVSLDEAKACVVFTIWDTGIGIAKEHLSYLFRPFVQLDSSLFRQYEGCGLGLVLAQYLVELHQGKVTVESEVGVGSRFKIWIPQNHLAAL